ncbi:MAG: oxygen-dependent protoporphyrinogen oxidase [Acidimicrobiales bacterium]
MKPSVAVIGGGLAGLSAAFDLHRGGVDVAVYEASDRWGGKVWSSLVGNRLVDAGADSFLARVPQGRALCADLGLVDELTSPVAPVPAYLHRDGHLHPLPAGTMLGVPTDLDVLIGGNLISPAGIARAKDDLHLPGTALDDDISVGAFFRERLGNEITERLIDPMVGGINASDIDRLSLRSASPQLAAAASAGSSIIRGLAEARARVGATLGSAGAAPVFHGLPGGIARIVDRLVEELPPTAVHLGADVSLEALDASRVILATPAPAAAALLADVSPTASELLSQIDYASVAQVTVELPRGAVDPVLDASGVLFPRVDGLLITACTWFSTKWAHYATSDSVLIRMTCGRFGDDRHAAFGDEQLAATLLAELGTVIDISDGPTAQRVHRWNNALPQYAPGHGSRIEAIVAALAADAPHIELAGAAYRGIGIPATIDSGRQAASRILASP